MRKKSTRKPHTRLSVRAHAAGGFLLPGIAHYMKNALTRYQLALEVCLRECEKERERAGESPSTGLPYEEAVRTTVEGYGTEVEPFLRVVDCLSASSMRAAERVSCGANAGECVRGETYGFRTGGRTISPVMVELLNLSVRRAGSRLEAGESVYSLDDENCIRAITPLVGLLSLLIETSRSETVFLEYTLSRGRGCLLLSVEGGWWKLQLIRMSLFRGAVAPFPWKAGRRGKLIRVGLLF